MSSSNADCAPSRRQQVVFVLHRGFHRVHHPEQFQRPDARRPSPTPATTRLAAPPAYPARPPCASPCSQISRARRSSSSSTCASPAGSPRRSAAPPRTRGQDVHQPREDAARARVILLRMFLSGQGARRRPGACYPSARPSTRRPSRTPPNGGRHYALIHAEELLRLLRAVARASPSDAAHRGVAERSFVLVRQHLGSPPSCSWTPRGRSLAVSGAHDRARAREAQRRAALRVARELLRGALVGEARRKDGPGRVAASHQPSEMTREPWAPRRVRARRASPARALRRRPWRRRFPRRRPPRRRARSPRRWRRARIDKGGWRCAASVAASACFGLVHGAPGVVGGGLALSTSRRVRVNSPRLSTELTPPGRRGGTVAKWRCLELAAGAASAARRRARRRNSVRVRPDARSRRPKPRPLP